MILEWLWFRSEEQNLLNFIVTFFLYRNIAVTIASTHVHLRVHPFNYWNSFFFPAKFSQPSKTTTRPTKSPKTPKYIYFSHQFINISFILKIEIGGETYICDYRSFDIVQYANTKILSTNKTIFVLTYTAYTNSKYIISHRENNQDIFQEIFQMKNPHKM